MEDDRLQVYEESPIETLDLRSLSDDVLLKIKRIFIQQSPTRDALELQVRFCGLFGVP